MVNSSRLLPTIIRSVGSHLCRGGVALALALPPSIAVAGPAKGPAPAKTDGPAKGDASKGEAAAAAPEVLPLQVSGKLSKDSRRALTQRLQSAAAGVTMAGGPHRLRLSVTLSGKRTYALTLTVLGPGDATAVELSETCDDCSLDQVGERVQGLVQQAAAKVAPEPAAPEAGSLAVRSTPLGARVRVDGTEHGLTPQVIELPAGEHTVVLDKPGFAEHQQTVTVEAGAELPLDVTLTAQGSAPEGKTKAGRGLKIGGLVLLGLGVAGVGAGVAMILIDEQNVAGCSGADVDFRGQCRERYDTLLGGILGTAAGGLGIAGGLAMMIQGHRVAVRARAGKQQASLGVTVRF